VLDERTIAFPNYDGNGMYLTVGSMLVNPAVGLLSIDFEGRKRMRLNGIASFDESDPLLRKHPEAQFVIRVRATEVFPNCPRSTSTSPAAHPARHPHSRLWLALRVIGSYEASAGGSSDIGSVSSTVSPGAT
jgi:hypothetical protein